MYLKQILDVIDRPAAWRWIVATYLPDGVKCPRCGELITGSRALASFMEIDRTYCKSCGSTFRAQGITPLRDTEWQPEEFVKLLILERSGWKPAEIAGQLGKSSACVRDMIERIELHPLRAA